MTATGWVLEETIALAGRQTVWSSLSPPYQDNGTDYFLTVSPPTGTKFYRLRR